MSEWLAAYEADVAADMAVTKATKATEARSEDPFVTIVPIVPHASECSPVLAPPEWVDALARLQACTRSDSIPADRWAQAVADAGYLVREWGAALSSCGWTLAEIFSEHCDRPLARYDTMGLCLLLQGRKIGPIDRERIAIRQPAGNSLHFRRLSSMPESVMLWELE